MTIIDKRRVKEQQYRVEILMKFEDDIITYTYVDVHVSYGYEVSEEKKVYK